MTVPAVVALGRGRRPAVALLLLRSFRTGSNATVVLGAAIGVLGDRFDDRTAEEFTTVSGFFRALLTPLMVLAVGLAMRTLVGPVAYLTALLVVTADHGDVVPTSDSRGRFSRSRDRLRLAGAYRSLRWTLAVKREATGRLGRLGRRLFALEVVMNILLGLAVVALILSIGAG